MKTYCVYASTGRDAQGRDYAFGDGVTASTRRLYAVCDSKEAAGQEMARLTCGRTMTRARMPGDGVIYPELTVGRFDPLEYVGRQHRDEYHGKRLASLRRDLIEQARRNAADLMGCVAPR